MKKRTAWILVAGVAAISIGAAAVGALALLLRGSRGRSPFGGGETYLALNLTGGGPEVPASEFGSFFESSPPSLRALGESRVPAARHPKVKAGGPAGRVL